MSLDPHLLTALDPEQLVSSTKRPYPRRALGRWTLALLLALRVYVLIAIPVVAWAFIQALSARG